MLNANQLYLLGGLDTKTEGKNFVGLDFNIVDANGGHEDTQGVTNGPFKLPALVNRLWKDFLPKLNYMLKNYGLHFIPNNIPAGLYEFMRINLKVGANEINFHADAIVVNGSKCNLMGHHI